MLRKKSSFSSSQLLKLCVLLPPAQPAERHPSAACSQGARGGCCTSVPVGEPGSGRHTWRGEKKVRSREERRGGAVTCLAQLYFAGRKSTSCSAPRQELGGESPGTAQAAAVRCGTWSCWSAQPAIINDLRNTFPLKPAGFPTNKPCGCLGSPIASSKTRSLPSPPAVTEPAASSSPPQPCSGGQFLALASTLIPHSET